MTTAIGVTEYGGPEQLQALDLPAEDLRPGTVRIRVRAAAVNPTDTGVRSGQRSTTGKPEDVADVPGMDVAGELTEIAPDVDTELAVGDHVMAIVVPSGQHGGYRGELVLPAASVVRIPSGASDIEAATLPMNGLTARFALDQLGLQSGQVLAVTGAAGAFGGYVIQLAKADGLVVVADAKESDEDLVRKLGADVVLPRGDEFAARVRATYPEGVDGLADGAVQNELALPAVKDGGAVVTVRGYTGDSRRGLRVTPVLVRQHAQEHAALDRLREQVESGLLTLRVADSYPAGQAAEAHRRFEAGGVRGRLVLVFD
ncbi:MAG: NADP-dependent oxidoreductase [Microlunatus sp.]|nr:NADP-dependent oxidoreductase [Microlunatus sp.]